VHFVGLYYMISRSQWPRGLRRRFAAARLLRFWVRIPLGAWMFVCCECCVFSGRGLCDELIPRPEESYRIEISWMRRSWPTGAAAPNKKNILWLYYNAGRKSIKRLDNLWILNLAARNLQFQITYSSKSEIKGKWNDQRHCSCEHMEVTLYRAAN